MIQAFIAGHMPHMINNHRYQSNWRILCSKSSNSEISTRNCECHCLSARWSVNQVTLRRSMPHVL